MSLKAFFSMLVFFYVYEAPPSPPTTTREFYSYSLDDELFAVNIEACFWSEGGVEI